MACALYEAAVAKFEAVLEADPGNRGVLRNCAFALYDLARLQPDPVSRATRQLLEVRVSSHFTQVQVLNLYPELPPLRCRRADKSTSTCLLNDFSVPGMLTDGTGCWFNSHQ